MSSNYVSQTKLIIPTPDSARLTISTSPVARVFTKSGKSTTNQLGYLLTRTWTLESWMTPVEAKQAQSLYDTVGNSVPFLFQDPLEPKATENLSLFSGDTGACGCVLGANGFGVTQPMIAYLGGYGDLDCVRFRPIFHVENLVSGGLPYTQDSVTRVITGFGIPGNVVSASFEYWQAYKFNNFNVNYLVKNNSIAIGQKSDRVVKVSVVLKESFDWMTPANSMFSASLPSDLGGGGGGGDEE
jgi:hypothetical protein